MSSSSSSSRFLTVAVPNVYGHANRSMPDLKTPLPTPSPSSASRAEYVCKRCRTRVATTDAVLSWEYRGARGPGALVTQATNLTPTAPSVLLMDSGAYRVQHLLCASPTCSPSPSPSSSSSSSSSPSSSSSSPASSPIPDAHTHAPVLGWRFLRASERAERWKEGCVVLELALLDEAPAPLPRSPLARTPVSALPPDRPLRRRSPPPYPPPAGRAPSPPPRPAGGHTSSRSLSVRPPPALARRSPSPSPSPSPSHRRAASDFPIPVARPATVARSVTFARRQQPLGPRLQRSSTFYAV